MAVKLPAAGRARRRRSGLAPMAEINVTPLVDVMLVLLIIFMVTAPLLVAGVPVDLPESRAEALPDQTEQVVISIGRTGLVFVDDQEVAAGLLPNRLTELGCTGAEPPLITMRADRGLDYGQVMGVMGELNRAGCNAVSLVTSGSSRAP